MMKESQCSGKDTNEMRVWHVPKVPLLGAACPIGADPVPRHAAVFRVRTDVIGAKTKTRKDAVNARFNWNIPIPQIDRSNLNDLKPMSFFSVHNYQYDYRNRKWLVADRWLSKTVERKDTDR
ncbi:unnamed protein product [Cylicocyclus nassatus]|uniref:Uncharacterized protein n=1 Tax=Cylicocyclus nassatus TaxID=53992 RepID=A0AA36MB10_CYLNA|nr:unnamed protein product [Cylicocyclus nassatus]